MSTIRLTPAAQQDLSSVWDYTSERWGSRQAEKYIREIQVSLERVAADPDRGDRETRFVKATGAM